jgi:hypothetical protein
LVVNGFFVVNAFAALFNVVFIIGFVVVLSTDVANTLGRGTGLISLIG